MKKIVSLIKCESYDFEKVKSSINKTIINLGGLEKYISKGDRILLKVNLLMKKKPEEATTTHPIFVQALSQILIDYGASVLIGDSPGGPFNEMMLKGIYEATGMKDVSLKTGAKLNANYKSFIKNNDKGLIMKKIEVVDMLNDVDKVISVSKLKTHAMMTLTGAVKNMFGVIPGVVKAQFHLDKPMHDDFADCLIDICMCANPILSFMDGIVAMEGHGPSSGTPKAMNVVLGSSSPYHLDKVAGYIINVDFNNVPTIKRSIERKICEDGLNDIDFKGDDINLFIDKTFDIPISKEILPKMFNKFLFLKPILQPKPVFIHAKCIGCEICEKNCPPKIISNSALKKPNAQLDKCIRCFCCQELCPKAAIKIHKPFLLKLMIKNKK